MEGRTVTADALALLAAGPSPTPLAPWQRRMLDEFWSHPIDTRIILCAR